jgi:CRP/FNR family transcriptional regulator, cyclic AMP receptor protein
VTASNTHAWSRSLSGAFFNSTPASLDGDGWLQLLAADPDLADGIPFDERRRAERVVVARATTVEHGAWVPDVHGHGETFALLVVSGFLMRDVILAGRRSVEILTPGDVFSTSEPAETPLVAHDVRWRALETAVVAGLDERFALAARRWPSLGAAITTRLLDQHHRTAVHLAIAQLPRVEQRTLAMLWHLAERCGRMTTLGLVMPLRLTHEAIGELVGARRPTVSLALAELADAGLIARRPEGGWVLAPESQATFLDGGISTQVTSVV